MRVFDHIVKHAGREGLGVQLHPGQDRGRFDGMHDVRLARFAGNAIVRVIGDAHGLCNQVDIRRQEVWAEGVVEVRNRLPNDGIGIDGRNEGRAFRRASIVVKGVLEQFRKRRSAWEW